MLGSPTGKARLPRFSLVLRGAVAKCVRALDWRPGGPVFEFRCGNLASELWQFR